MIDDRDEIRTVAFLVDGKHVLSGGCKTKIRRWRVEDGEEVGSGMEAGNGVFSIAVSRDGKWIVSGVSWGWVQVWNAATRKKVAEFTGHDDFVCAIDVSPDVKRIATGSKDRTVCVWSFAGERLLGPWKHHRCVAAVKFSPDGRRIATATWEVRSVRVYDAQNGHLLFDVQVQVGSYLNTSLAWADDGNRLFVLSRYGNIHTLDVSTGLTLSKWQISRGPHVPRCIALASNGSFIAASAGQSVSFWNTSSQEQIGLGIELTHGIECMALSMTDLVVSGDQTISLYRLRNIIPRGYLDDVSVRCNERERSANVETVDHGDSLRAPDVQDDSPIANPEETVHALRSRLAESRRKIEWLESTIESLRAQLESSNSRTASLDRTIQELRDEQKNSLGKLPRGDPRTQEMKLENLKKTIEQLRIQLVNTQRKAHGLICAHEQKHQIELLYVQGRIHEAVESFHEMGDTLSEDVRRNEPIADWLLEFTNRCMEKLEKIGDEASNRSRPGEAVSAYSAALSLSASSSGVFNKWVGVMLISGLADDVLSAAEKFKVSKFVVYRTICDSLEGDGRLREAAQCLQRMQNDPDLSNDAGTYDGRWEGDFRDRCAEKLENLGDAARDSQRHIEAIEHYFDALSLHPSNSNEILLKRRNEVMKLRSLFPRQK